MRSLTLATTVLILFLGFLGCSKNGGTAPPDGGGPNEGGAGNTTSTGGSSSGGDGPVPGGGGGSSGPPPGGASRTEGLAPLFVYFDATGDFNDESYLESTFLWDFDVNDTDPAGRHETLSGFIVGHVYERPGTYLTRLTIYRTGSDPETKEWTITASAFAGTTVYVSSAGNDDNPGTIEEPIASVGKAFGEKAKPNTQILFRNGDTFDFEFTNLSGEGPVLVTGYSDPASPSEDKPTLHSTFVGDNAWSCLPTRTQDWRIVGLRIHADGTTFGDNGPRYPGGFDMAGAEDTLLMDNEMFDLGGSVIYLSGTGNAIFDNDLHDYGTYGMYVGGDTNERQTIVGNNVHDDKGGNAHLIRIHPGVRSFVGENTFLASAGIVSNTQVRGNSDHVILYKNILNSDSAFHPQNETSEEYVHHCVFDSNLLYKDQEKSSFQMAATKMVVRNNVFYRYRVVLEEHPLVGAAADIGITYNDFVCPDGNCQQVVACDACTTNITVEDNVDDTADLGSSVTVDLVMPPTVTIDALAEGEYWVPSSGDPVVDSGITPAPALDFYGQLRDAEPDQGAVELPD